MPRPRSPRALRLSPQVLKKRPDFKEKPWPNISASAKDFVKKLLKKDPRARPTAAQALCECHNHQLFESYKRVQSPVQWTESTLNPKP